ncbi:MAG: hypothetical protein BGO78_10415 [Chloroflexi bacterium 44-23]|nr:MAG: hypothetical protein BGO78_10415 [Chloroflexi bacterium 44-23]
MCRAIKPLFNFDPPASAEDIRAAAIQYVRKISGYRVPSKANQLAFNAAVEAITYASSLLLDSLVTDAPPKNRAEVIARAKERSTLRFERKGG